MIGTKLVDRYEVVGELGRGGMGVVYRARDPLLNREVAVKIVPPSLLTPQAEERFQREAQVVAQMNHPSIVSIFDIGRHEGSLFFLMPVVTGANFRAFMSAKPRSLGDVIDVAVQVADALEYSHSRGVIHRDIKPENIMVTEDGGTIRVYVMDFGLAKASSETRLTRTGMMVGTVTYFSPEQVAARDVDQRSDIYSLGTVIYEALAGEAPFTGEVQSLLYRIVHENPRPLRSFSEELGDIVMKCLVKDPARRYQRAGELADALRRFAAKLQEEDKSKSVVLSTVMTAQVARPALSPFIGREKEFAELQRRLNAAIDGECQFVAIGGEPGIGKSRLVEELENLARARKIRVVHGRFVEQNRAFAYQGFCELAQDYFRARETKSSSGEHADFSDLADDLISLFPVLGEISAIRSGAHSASRVATDARKPEDRTYIYELLARMITRIAGGQPLVVVLDNLHGAEMSLDALQYVVQRLGPTPTLIIGTYRHNELDRGHPLQRMLDSFGDHPSFASILLGPLSSDEHRKLVESLVNTRKLASGVAERLFTATEANPFFTRELVRSLIDSGGIVRDDSGAWTLSREAAISADALPATIQQAVEKRIERLPEEMREVLSIASVLGRTFDFDDLEMLAEEQRNLDRIVDQLLGEGLLEEERESRGDKLTFASGIVRDVLYGSLSRRRRRSLHRRYGEYLEKRHQGRLERVYPQLVHHFSEGDVPEKTVDYGLKQMARSLTSFAADEVLHIGREVLEFVKDQEWAGDRTIEADARVLLAEAHRQQGNTDGALREIDLAVKIFARERDAARAANATLLGTEMAWQGRRIDEARRRLSDGLETARAGGDRGVLARFLSLAATVANLGGEYDKAKAFLEEAEWLVPKAAAEQPVAAAARGGVLSVALAGPASAAEPSFINTDEDSEVLALVFETLVNTDDEGHLVPMLCDRWESLHDARAFLLTLRRDVTFDGGAPLTARDVKLAFERVAKLRSAALPPALSAIDGIDSATGEIPAIIVRGDDALEIGLAEPLPIYPALLTDPILGITKTNDDGEVIGTGPFRVTRRDANTVVLARNAEYWRGQAPCLDGIEFRTVARAADIAKGFRDGTYDLARDLLPDDLEAILRDSRLRQGLVEAPKKNTYFMLFNPAGPLSKDEGLRRALSGSLRVHDLVWRTLGRLAQPAAGLIPPGIFGHDAGKRRASMSRDEALHLVANLGMQKVRLRASIHPLYRERYRALTDAVFEIWRDLGVEIEIVTPTIDSYREAFRSNDEIDVLIGRWNSDYDDPDNFTYGLFNSKTGTFGRYLMSAESDRLLEEARAESDAAARQALYRSFEDDVIRRGIVVPLFHEIDYRIAGPKVRGIQFRTNRPYVNYTTVGRAEEDKSSSAEVRVGGGVIHVAFTEDIPHLDPALNWSADQNEVSPMMFDTLTRCVEGARVVPWLAEDVQAEDGGRRYRIRLRKDVRFHDGRRLTTRDVRHSFERILWMENSVYKSMMPPICGADDFIARKSSDLKGIRIISATELTIELDQRLAFLPALLTVSVLSILPEGTDRVDGNWRSGCVGTGPFRVVHFEPGRRLELERNPFHWREDLPKCDGVVLQLGVSAEAIRKGFVDGALSIANDLTPADVDALRHDREFAAGYREVPGLSTYMIAANCNVGPLADESLRHLLFGCFDVEEVVRRTLGRMAVPAVGLIPPGLIGYSSLATRRRVTEGRERLRGLKLTASVHPMFFGHYAGLAKELLEVLGTYGVEVKIMNRTMEEFGRLNLEGNTDLLIGRWVGDYPDTDTFAVGVLARSSGFAGGRCGSEEIDALGQRARSEIDPAARHAIYRELEELLAREARLLPLFHGQIYRFARPEIAGLTLNFQSPQVPYEMLRVTR